VSISGDLLRMLVPAVSPVPTQGPGTAPRNLPIESRSFDSLLEQAGQIDTGVEPTADVGTEIEAAAAGSGSKPADEQSVLSGLSGIESIHNASLRRIVADAVRRA